MQTHPLTLAFPGEQEKAFQAVFFKDSLPVTRIALFLSGLLYALFGYLDYLMVGEHLLLFLTIRFGIVIPFITSVILASFMHFFQKVWQHLLLAAMLLGGAGISVMIGQFPENGSYYGGLMLIFFAGYFFVRLRFFWATLGGWGNLIIFNIIMAYAPDIDYDLLFSFNFFYLAANLIGMFAAYYIEISSRKNFLLNQQLIEKKKELEDVNLNLEAMVENRTRDLAESEQRFRNLADLLPLMVYETDVKGNVMYVNLEALKQMAVTKDEIASDTNIFDFIIPDERKNAIAEFHQSLNTPDVSAGEYHAMRKDGTSFPVLVYSKPIVKHNKSIGIRSVAVDLTEQKTNEKLRTQVTVAKQSADFKQSFLANMSHEIRTPLTGIMGITEILSSTPLDENQKDHLNTLRQSTENLREIINQILDYSKIEAGKVMLKPEAFPTNALFINATKLFDSICRKPIEFNVEVDENLPDFIKADMQRVQQIISNLISNAIKFTSKGTITLRAKAEQWINETRLLAKIEVEDTGIGIREEQQPLLFRPFSQIDHKDTRNFEGTGLGLSICKELASLLNGEIGVQSESGKGSLFWFTFDANLAQQSEVKSTKGDPCKKNPLPQLRILLVEDKVVNQKVIGLMLTSQGHMVTHAENGLQALELYQPQLFDLILMDIQMPGMDGLTATRLLREQHTHLPPIVGLSANAFEGDRQKYMSQGMDEYLTKPFKLNEFKQILSKLHII